MELTGTVPDSRTDDAATVHLHEASGAGEMAAKCKPLGIAMQGSIIQNVFQENMRKNPQAAPVRTSPPFSDDPRSLPCTPPAPALHCLPAERFLRR